VLLGKARKKGGEMMELKKKQKKIIDELSSNSISFADIIDILTEALTAERTVFLSLKREREYDDTQFEIFVGGCSTYLHCIVKNLLEKLGVDDRKMAISISNDIVNTSRKQFDEQVDELLDK